MTEAGKRAGRPERPLVGRAWGSGGLPFRIDVEGANGIAFEASPLRFVAPDVRQTGYAVLLKAAV